MVEFVNASTRRRLVAALTAGFALALDLAWPVAQAQTLGDPTRPANAALEAQANDSNAPVLPVLQSVLISPRRKVAVISGQTLHVGEKFGTAMLIKISAQEVVLKDGTELQTLKLYPDIQKQMAGKPAKSTGKPAVNSVKDH